MESIRNQIWDFLYRSDRPRTIADIARQIGNDEDTVRKAIRHDWFNVFGEEVTIAYAKS